MLVLLTYAFLSGLATILAPCIWPLLPIVLSSSVAGKGHQRPLGVILGIMISFAFFTLTISLLISLFHIDANILRVFAVIVLILLGLMMIIPSFGSYIDGLVSRLSAKLGLQPNGTNNGFLPGFISGLSLGIVWSPCAGPILASIAALAATGKVTITIVFITIVYVIGIGIPLLAFAYGGQKLVANTRFLSKYTGKIQQVFGVIMILTAIAILTNYDKAIETSLLDAFPALTQSVQNIDANPQVKSQLDQLKGKTSQQSVDSSGVLNANYPAPEFAGITKWLNPDDTPFSIQSLRGKVVLIDFWTYTCINCIRTLPYVTAWYDKYKMDGFVVIGVHTPEFAFEHDTNNVKNAIKQFNIHYPVAQDNNYTTWNAYNNQYWPAEYLIDKAGNVRRTHFGEGEYDQSEQAIQLLLKEAGHPVSSTTVNMPDQTPGNNISPETYMGANRMQYYFPGGNTGVVKKVFSLADKPDINSFSLGGEWDIAGDYAISGNKAVLTYNFTAQKVFLVLRPPSCSQSTCGAGKITVLLDGKQVSAIQAGDDVQNGSVSVTDDRLYNLVKLNSIESHVLRLEFQTPGIQSFAFTFG